MPLPGPTRAQAGGAVARTMTVCLVREVSGMRMFLIVAVMLVVMILVEVLWRAAGLRPLRPWSRLALPHFEAAALAAAVLVMAVVVTLMRWRWRRRRVEGSAAGL
jgi:uncharacterized membrane protein